MRTTALVLTFAIGGCAADCSGDWYQVGARDGRIGAEPQIESYAARCSGVQPDAARYAEGYRDGAAQRPRVPSF
jgi:hypothetical protein